MRTDTRRRSSTPLAKSIDWPWIEAQYRAGQLSPAQIAVRHARKCGVDVHPRTIEKAAVKNGWKRDQAPQIAKRAAKKVEEHAQATPPKKPPHSRARARKPTTLLEEAVDEAAEAAAQIVLSHRRLTARLRAHADTLSEKFAEMMDRPKCTPRMLAQLANALNAMAGACHRIIPLERQAFALDGDRPGDKPRDPFQEREFNEEAVLIYAEEIQRRNAERHN